MAHITNRILAAMQWIDDKIYEHEDEDENLPLFRRRSTWNEIVIWPLLGAVLGTAIATFVGP